MPKKSKYYFDGRYYCCKIRKGATSKEGYSIVRAKTEEELDRKLGERRHAASRGVDLNDGTIVAEWCVEWYGNRKAALSPSEQSYFRPMINNLICPAIGNVRLLDVRAEHLQRVMAQAAGKSKSYQGKLVRLLHRLFADAFSSKLTMDDPSIAIKPGGVPAQQKQSLTKEQVATLFAAIEGTRAEIFCALCYYAGLRSEEACGLTWDDVHLEADTPYLDISHTTTWPERGDGKWPCPTKTPSGVRKIPIHPELMRRLNAVPKSKKKNPFVVAGHGKQPVTYQSKRRIWDIVRGRMTYKALGKPQPKRKPGQPGPVGIPRTIDVYFTAHQLRHTFASNMIAGGTDIKKVQYLMGHADATVLLKIYAQVVGNQPADLSGAVSGSL